MLKKTAFALFCGIFVFSTTHSESANAQCCQHGFAGGILHANSLRSGGGVAVPNPPYFAIHPPVYYDRVVSRSYGISPYAVPPGVVPVENMVVPAEKTVFNPFFKPEKEPESRKSETVSAGHSNEPKNSNQVQKIINPFYLKKVAAVRNAF